MNNEEILIQRQYIHELREHELTQQGKRKSGRPKAIPYVSCRFCAFDKETNTFYWPRKDMASTETIQYCKSHYNQWMLAVKEHNPRVFQQYASIITPDEEAEIQTIVTTGKKKLQTRKKSAPTIIEVVRHIQDVSKTPRDYYIESQTEAYTETLETLLNMHMQTFDDFNNSL